jgi:hypothetical protein
MLAAMFSGRYAVQRDRSGAVFLDRPPAVFERVLEYLRSGRVRLPPQLEQAVELEGEFEYFNLPFPPDAWLRYGEEAYTRTLSMRVEGSCLIPRGTTRLYAIDTSLCLSVWDTRSARLLHQVRIAWNAGENILWDASPRYIAAISAKRLALVDVESGARLHEVPPPAPESRALCIHDDCLLHIALNATEVSVFSLPSLELQAVLGAYPRHLHAADKVGDLVYAIAERSIVVWRLSTQQELRCVQFSGSPMCAPFLAPQDSPYYRPHTVLCANEAPPTGQYLVSLLDLESGTQLWSQLGGQVAAGGYLQLSLLGRHALLRGRGEDLLAIEIGASRPVRVVRRAFFQPASEAQPRCQPKLMAADDAIVILQETKNLEVWRPAHRFLLPSLPACTSISICPPV